MQRKGPEDSGEAHELGGSMRNRGHMDHHRTGGRGCRGPTDETVILASRLAYHLRCLREDATDSDLSPLERLALSWAGQSGFGRSGRPFQGCGGLHDEPAASGAYPAPPFGTAPAGAAPAWPEGPVAPEASRPEFRTAWAHTCVLAEVLFPFLGVGGETTNQDRQPYRTAGLAVALACFLGSATTS